MVATRRFAQLGKAGKRENENAKRLCFTRNQSKQLSELVAVLNESERLIAINPKSVPSTSNAQGFQIETILAQM
jgi:hypothetical protein